MVASIHLASLGEGNLLGLTSRANLSLSVKLILGFLAVSIPSVAILGGISFYALRDLTQVNRQLHEISRSLEAVRALETAFGRIVTPLSEFVISGRSQEDRSFVSLIGQVEVRLASCADATCHGATRQPIEMARSLIPYVQGIKDRGTTLMNAGEPGTGADKFHLLREIHRLVQEANQQLERMSSTLLLRVESLQRKSEKVDQRVRRLMLASMFSVVAVAIITAYFISRRLLKPVRELVVGTRHVMEGDLAYRVPIVEKDEIGELAQSFNAMAQEIQQHRGHLEKMVQAKTDELKQAQESLLQSEKLASIGLLAAGVAHELNNPLTSILMNINLLIEETGNQPELQEELKRISDDTVRCKTIIDDLRDFSRRRVLDIHSCDLNEVVRKAVGLMSHQLKLSGIELFAERDPPLLQVPCDPGRMQQVLMNIFDNAIQAMPKGGNLTVRTGVRESFAEIAVKDTGPGIAAEIRGKIFDPFFTTKSEGTGLGLSIAYGIMEEHGGSIAVESLTVQEARTGESGTPGTTVRLFLPVNGASQKD